MDVDATGRRVQRVCFDCGQPQNSPAPGCRKTRWHAQQACATKTQPPAMPTWVQQQINASVPAPPPLATPADFGSYYQRLANGYNAQAARESTEPQGTGSPPPDQGFVQDVPE